MSLCDRSKGVGVRSIFRFNIFSFVIISSYLSSLAVNEQHLQRDNINNKSSDIDQTVCPQCHSWHCKKHSKMVRDFTVKNGPLFLVFQTNKHHHNFYNKYVKKYPSSIRSQDSNPQHESSSSHNHWTRAPTLCDFTVTLPLQ